MAHLKTIVECTWDDEDGKEKKDRYFLLHWGIKYDLVADGSNSMVPVQYTVAIVQNVKTGFIETFLPEQVRVLGVNIKEGGE